MLKPSAKSGVRISLSEALVEKDKEKEEKTPFRSYDTSGNEDSHEEPVLNDASYADDPTQAASDDNADDNEAEQETEDSSAPDLSDLIDNL